MFKLAAKYAPYMCSELKHGVRAIKNCVNVLNPSAFKGSGKTMDTPMLQSQTAMEAFRARRLVIMLWYLKDNLTAIKRSTLIKAR